MVAVTIMAGVPLLMAYLITRAVYMGIRWEKIEPGSGRCTNCGYDLTGNVSGRCPECGQDI
ncbi:MAG: hypothetical protein JXO22_06395 [Phycisphaerae bacterium]|nr:hypothetical protein [Phycisphaerae bacterium]